MAAIKKIKTGVKDLIDTNPVEAFRDIGGGVTTSLKDDLAKQSVNDLWDQLLGTGESKYSGGDVSHGEMEEGKEVSLIDILTFQNSKTTEKTRETKSHAEPALNYHREITKAGERERQIESRETEKRIEEILTELRQIVSASQELAVQFREVTVEQHIETVGEYHINFFQWVLSIVRAARMRIEDSSSWLSLFKSKKAKQGYWQMFKKHGTTFGLSNERVVATQTG